MNTLLIITIIAAGLFLLCLELTVCMIASSIYRKHREKLGVRSVKEALESLLKQDIKPWEVDT